MTDTPEIVTPQVLPRPVSLAIDCPRCGEPVAYEPAEDDAGAFYAQEDWPVCVSCDVLIDVPPCRLVRADGVYHSRSGA